MEGDNREKTTKEKWILNFAGEAEIVVWEGIEKCQQKNWQYMKIPDIS